MRSSMSVKVEEVLVATTGTRKLGKGWHGDSVKLETPEMFAASSRHVHPRDIIEQVVKCCDSGRRRDE